MTAQDKPRVYVCGHRNPDTDSIASAIGYAELKNQLEPACQYVPVRLGNPNPQTQWLIERSGATLPVFLPHAKLRVRDIMRTSFPVAHRMQPVRTVGLLMAEQNLDLVTIVDDDEVLEGVLTERALARRYIRESREASRLDVPTPLSSIVEVLEGTLVVGDDRTIQGRVFVQAMDHESESNVATGDVVVVGDRRDSQVRAIEAGVSLLVLSNGTMPSDEVIALAREQGIAIVSSPLDSYVTSRMITLSEPCHSFSEGLPLTVGKDDLISDVAERIKDVHYRAAVTIGRGGRPIGLVTRSDLVSPPLRRILLVDHAERGQSVPGVEEAEIVEILDHHHIGSIETRMPVPATFDPVGSTATLVIERFRNVSVDPVESTATMLIGAILSDTVLLTSPTTTPRDEAAIAYLEELLGLDAATFGREMFERSSDVAHVPAAELVTRDSKEYDVDGGRSVSVAQVESVGGAVNARKGELLDAIEAERAKRGDELFALMLTDILAGDTVLLSAGGDGLVERAFGKRPVDGAVELPGVLSRKKQVAPELLRAAAASS
ncbi:MAG: manganese-dependent inorganic pyrophosphatase [Solirubrobacteraceae bacterium]|jgi:manganese-dependent inorganic pyrophosphatase|nr:manganese-dependent inorganic pyrophosphatase [Solirubrobacteraceae bacterium]